jgi:hydroxymethylglutaryl-CoA lyase
MKKNKVQIVEVGLRDGLQNERVILSVEDKIVIYNQMIQAGVTRLEVGAFVSAEWVPQMANTKELLVELNKSKKNDPSTVRPSVLVPNTKGFELALKQNLTEVAVFAAATESFSKKNINCSIDESFERFAPVLKSAKKNKIKVRGYLSVCFGCPFEGEVSEKKVIELATRLYKMGCYEISIGDTIGVAHAGQVKSLFTKLKRKVPVQKLAGHFHNTRGQALVNILMSYQMGLRVFDSSIGGLGGCPYAPGASGNVSTEDVVYMFNGLGIETGINLKKYTSLHPWLQERVQHQLLTHVK